MSLRHVETIILLWVTPLSGIHIEHFDFDPLSPWTTTCFKRIICCFPWFQDVQLAVDKILSAHEEPMKGAIVTVVYTWVLNQK